MATTKAERQKWGLYPSRDVDVETALKLLDWSWYRFARSTEKLDLLSLKPTKSNIVVKLVALAWAPQWRAADGTLVPAWL